MSASRSLDNSLKKHLFFPGVGGGDVADVEIIEHQIHEERVDVGHK